MLFSSNSLHCGYADLTDTGLALIADVCSLLTFIRLIGSENITHNSCGMLRDECMVESNLWGGWQMSVFFFF